MATGIFYHECAYVHQHESMTEVSQVQAAYLPTRALHSLTEEWDISRGNWHHAICKLGEAVAVVVVGRPATEQQPVDLIFTTPQSEL